MTPNFRPFVDQADAAFPHLRRTNTYASICELVQRSLMLAGPDWCHVGKTDPEGGKYAPAGMVPFDYTYTDGLGVSRSVRIVAVSHDAIWHLPSHQQIKVISNSAANSDPDVSIHGVGNIACYLIDPVNYRLQNPPVATIPASGAPNPAPLPVPPPTGNFPPQNETYAFGMALNEKYRVDRHAILIGEDGDSMDVYVNLKGMAIWLADYLRHRVNGKGHAEAQLLVFATIDAIPL